MAKVDFYCSNIFEYSAPIDPYSIRFGLDRLLPGIDNIRYDVNLSHEFCQLSGRIINGMLISEIKDLEIYPPDKALSRMDKEWEAFRKTFSEVMLSAVNRAKQAREPQIIFLAQASVTKMLLEEIQSQFEKTVEKFKQLIRKHEVSNNYELGDLFRIKEEMATLFQNRQLLTRNVAKGMIKHVCDAWQTDVQKNCVANFGHDAVVPDEFFQNPMIFVDGKIDDFFMIEAYALFGHRMDDPLRYDALLGLLKNFLATARVFEAMHPQEDRSSQEDEYDDGGETESQDARNVEADGFKKIGRLLCRVEIMEVLFDSVRTLADYKRVKQEKGDKAELLRLKSLAAAQKKLFNCFYKECKKTGLLSPIIAYYEMQAFLSLYCPPLLPHDLLNFLTAPGERDKIANKFKRVKSLAGESFSLRPLYRLAVNFQRIRARKKKDHLLAFLKTFAAYHRDRQNYHRMKENLQWVNLLDDEKTVNLSRVNRTLYEFYCSGEAVSESKPIRNHVILKADVRGSTEITRQLSRKRLNPASYFSLNFFDPINNVLPVYGAGKVFIEGDALILSIFEEEETPEGWYGVARACGLAMRILQIVKRYNIKSKKHNLPILEQGIGICYTDASPAFLFDGDNRIMISSAINRADRLSGCTRFLRRHFSRKNDQFNIYVFSIAAENDDGEEEYWRYNVNGIELEPAGFEKLKREIDLSPLNIAMSETAGKKVRVHTGIFPTCSGQYQRLVVREAKIPRIDPNTLRVKGLIDKKYYEVCTHPAIYEKVKAVLKS